MGARRPGAPTLTTTQRFYPVANVALFVRLLLGIFIVGSIGSVLTSLPYRNLLLEIDRGREVLATDIIAAEDRYNMMVLLVAGTYLITAAAFLTWFWRMYANLTALGRSRRRRPGWAIGGWLIPFAGLVIPYGIGAEIWTQSKADGEPKRRDPNMEPVISWWALFLIMTLTNVVGSFLLDGNDAAADVAAYVGVDIVASLVAIASAVAATRFVRMSTDRQLELHRVVADAP